MTPRFIRCRDAPAYLGMDRDRFNGEVRPNLTEIPIGVQGVAFDRLDLDAWADDYKQRNGRPGAQKGAEKWDERRLRAYTRGKGSTTSTRTSADMADFVKAVEQAKSKKRNAT